MGLVRAMVTKVDKEEHSVGMQNFQYSPSWDEFVHIISIHSPQVHKFLAEHFPVWTNVGTDNPHKRQLII